MLGGTALVPVLLSGCARTDPQELRPLPDVAVLTAAIASEERLIALYEAARGAHTGLAAQLDPVLAHHREHLTVLRRHYVPGTGDRSATPVPVARPSVPSQAGKALSLLRRAETEAATARANDVERVAPGVAQLLACIGACEAGHAAALSGTSR